MNFRSKILACFISVALIAVTLPVRLDFNALDKRVELKANEAEAVVPVAGAAAAFLGEVAAACGLTASELVATVVGTVTVASGLNFARETGVEFGNTAADNLRNVINAAGYPDWDELTQEEQEDWGTEENYNAAKFNELADAFGLGETRDEYYSNYASSGGGNIDYTESESHTLEKLGRIGTRWVNGASNTVQDLLDSLQPDYMQTLQNYTGYSTTFKEYYRSDYSLWPSSAPNSLFVGSGSYYRVIRTYYGSSSMNAIYVTASSSTVYWLIYKSVGPYNTQLVIHPFSKEGFNYGSNIKTYSASGVVPADPAVNTNTNATKYTVNEHDIYVGSGAGGSIDSNSQLLESTFPVNNVTVGSWEHQVMEQILYGDDQIGDWPVDVVGYPDNISEDADKEIYYPTGGIVPNINFNAFETAPEENPGTGGGTDLSEVIELLQRFHFTVDWNLLVQDNPLRNAVLEIVSAMNHFHFYNSTGQLKVHDEGVFDAISDMSSYLGGLLTQIQSTLSGFFVTDTAGDIIGDLDFPDLGDKAADLVDTISTLAPFGAMALLSELVAILSQTGHISKPEMSFDFNFMPDHEYDITIDLSWLDDVRPVINVFCIITLIVGLYGCTARLVELEAAA